MVEYTDKSAWNLSQGLLFEIQTLLVEANSNYLSGHIDKWFFNLKAVKMRIIANLNQNERDEAKKLEEQISIDLENWRLRRSAKPAVEGIEKYNELLFDYMEVYGLLLKKERDTTRIN